MSLAGSAFLALWNDFSVEHDAEYNRWHSIEHVPERVALPGFISGRRYVALDAAQQPQKDVERYFTWYELDALSVLDSAEYRRVLAHPTRWSASMRPRFRNFQRAACTLAWTSGEGIGGCVAVLRYRAMDGDAFDETALHSLRELPGVTGVHKGIAQASGQAPPWAAPSADSKPPVSSVLIIESYALGPLRAALSMLAGIAPRASVTAGLYSLAYVCTHREPPT